MKWLEELTKKWAAAIAHCFVLHGNATDTVNGQGTAVDYLLQSSLFSKRDIIIRYDRAGGIQFPIPAHQSEFFKLTADAEIEPEDAEDILPRDPGPALSVIEKVLRFRKDDNSPKVGLVIDFSENIFPNMDIASMSAEERTCLTRLLKWARDPGLVSIGTPIVLVTEHIGDLNASIRTASSRIEAIEINLPTYEDRLKYIQHYVTDDKEINMEIELAQMARMTAGLKCLHIEDIFLRCKSEDISVTADAIKQRKQDIISLEFDDVLEILEPEYDFTVIGGMDHVKEFFYKNVINPVKDGNLRRVPMGILLPGPPGTGKTLLAECLAKESGMNCCALNMAKISDKWVGSSERNLEKALSCIKALSPTITIIDEIDQTGLSRDNSGDSGVSNRIFKRLLEFMSDSRMRGQVVFVGLTNRPDKMDAALKRPGRFDKKLPILAPTMEERKNIFEVMFQRYKIPFNLTNEQLDQAAAVTDGYTGAEIEALTLKASEVAEDNGSDIVTSAHIQYALDVYRPTTQQIDEMTRLAIAECNDLDLLPVEYRERIKRERERKKEVADDTPAPRRVRQ